MENYRTYLGDNLYAEFYKNSISFSTLNIEDIYCLSNTAFEVLVKPKEG